MGWPRVDKFKPGNLNLGLTVRTLSTVWILICIGLLITKDETQSDHAQFIFPNQIYQFYSVEPRLNETQYKQLLNNKYNPK